MKQLEAQLLSQEETIKELKTANEALQTKHLEEVQMYESKISHLQSEMSKYTENVGLDNKGNTLYDELKQAKIAVSCPPQLIIYFKFTQSGYLKNESEISSNKVNTNTSSITLSSVDSPPLVRLGRSSSLISLRKSTKAEENKSTPPKPMSITSLKPKSVNSASKSPAVSPPASPGERRRKVVTKEQPENVVSILCNISLLQFLGGNNCKGKTRVAKVLRK